VDAVVIEDGSAGTAVSTAPASSSSSQGGESAGDELRRARILRLRISDTTGLVKLETRIPAGFLQGLSMIPAVSGLNLEAVIGRALREQRGDAGRGRPLISTPVGSGDLLEVFLE
jgi:hypothetical protein